MILSETTQTLQLKLGEAKAVNDCDFTVSYADTSSLAFLPALSHGVTNGTTPVTVAAAPDIGVARMAKEVRLHNNDTIAHVVTLQLHDGANTRIITSQTVAAGGDFGYVDNVVPGGGGSGDWHAGPVSSLSAGVSVASNVLTVDGPQTFTDNRLLSISCVATNIVALVTTYVNGAAGVGATLTATANGALSMDGYTPVVGDNVLVGGDGSAIIDNGVYTVTQVGDGSHPYILTRHSRCNQPAHFVDLRVSISDWGNTHWTSDFLSEIPMVAVGTTTVYFSPIGLGGGLYVNTIGNGLQISTPGGQIYSLGISGAVPFIMAYNAGGVIPAAVNAMQLTWNYDTGTGEADYWCTYGAAITSHIFWQRTGGGAATRLLDIGPTGDTRAYGRVEGTSVRTGSTSGPTWTTGAGVPAATEPKGSLYSRTGGGVGTTLYVSQGGGTWNPVAGV